MGTYVTNVPMTNEVCAFVEALIAYGEILSIDPVAGSVKVSYEAEDEYTLAELVAGTQDEILSHTGTRVKINRPKPRQT